MPSRATLRGLLFVAIAAAAWGAGGVVAAVLYRASGLGPVAVSFWRTVIAVLLLAVVGRPRSRPDVALRRWITLVTDVGLGADPDRGGGPLPHRGTPRPGRRGRGRGGPDRADAGCRSVRSGRLREPGGRWLRPALGGRRRRRDGAAPQARWGRSGPHHAAR